MSPRLGNARSPRSHRRGREKYKVIGILAYLGILFWSLVAAKDSPFAKYHANQGSRRVSPLESPSGIVMSALYLMGCFILVRFYARLGSSACSSWFIAFPSACSILGIINAANGKCVPLPLIGGIKLLK
jgi:hypothetical protein